MSYTKENQKIDDVTEELKENLKLFREIAENRIMDTSEWNGTHRGNLKILCDQMFELQIKLNEL